MRESQGRNYDAGTRTQTDPEKPSESNVVRLEADLRLKITRDLREIERMYADLWTEALHHADDPSNIPGGDAMVMLAPGADVEAFGYMQLSAILGRIDPHIIEEVIDGDIEPPLSFLASWVDLIREERGQPPTERRAGIDGEIRYLRGALDWMTALDEDGQPWWIAIEDFAIQLRRVRRALEVVLRDGEQVDFGAPCLNDGCGRPLLKLWGIDAHTDRWRCIPCERWYNHDEYKMAVKQAYLLKAEWLTTDDLHAVYRVSAGSVTSWASGEKATVRKRLDQATGRMVYNVEDVVTRRNNKAS